MKFQSLPTSTSPFWRYLLFQPPSYNLISFECEKSQGYVNEDRPTSGHSENSDSKILGISDLGMPCEGEEMIQGKGLRK